MSLSSTITLIRQDDTTASFKTQSVNGDSTTRIDDASTKQLPVTLRVASQSKGAGLEGNLRSLVQYQKTFADSTKQAVLTIGLTMVVPNNTTLVPVSEVISGLRQLLDFFSSTTAPAVDSAIVNALLRGES